MATEPAQQPELPVSLPGFTLLGVAGRGGMGVVYRAEQASPRRLVALKLLGGAAVTPERLAAFQREAQVIASLEHPYIVPLYGFGEHAGQPYLAMRYLRGGSAAARLTRGPVDLATAAGWVRAVAAALDFAHQRGLVHRDVKPSNILLDESGSAYLTDFGIAGALADPASGQGGALGSAAYMSPEQGRGEAVDRRADIYALAVTLFELLTGQKPYTAETALGVIVRHIHDPIPSARAIHPAVPPAVDALIQRGMAKSAA
ncbi:MAG: serine/threonine protein kinase, partial [Anaerolineales bacterium]|nr:serine/threonine protein kinase [Anaerolineales bacterium]